MRSHCKSLIVAYLIVFLALSASATPFPLYVSESGGATQAGTSGDPWSVTTLNNGGVPANWTVSIEGVISEINVQANGETVLIPSGSGISTPNSPSVYVFPSVTGLTIDGTGGGYMNCTQNGTALAHQTAVWAIQLGSGCSGLSVKNLAITNIYVMSSPTDANDFSDSAGGIYANALTGSNFFGNLTMTYCSTAILAGGSCTCVYSNCSFVNCNHDIFPSSDSTIIEYCFFGPSAVWDQNNNNYHHDSIIWVGGTSPPNTLFVMRNCTFNGDMGLHNTAYFYNDSGYADTMLFYNNLYRVWPGNYLNDGVFTGSGVHYNETFIDASGYSGGNAALRFPAQYNTVENCVFNGFGVYIIMSGPTFSNNTLSNNIYANPANPAANLWQIAGNNYTGAQFTSYTNFSGDGGSKYISSSPGVLDTGSGNLLSGSPAIGAANTNGYAIGVTNGLNNMPRLPNGPVDAGALVYTTPGLSYGLTFTNSLAFP